MPRPRLRCDPRPPERCDETTPRAPTRTRSGRAPCSAAPSGSAPVRPWRCLPTVRRPVTAVSCASDRAALIALSAALGAGVGLGMDAIIGLEFTGAPLPGPPASERRVGLPPPSSRGAGLRFKLAW